MGCTVFSCAQLSTFSSCALPFRLHGRKKIDFPNKVENNIHFLYLFPVHFFRRMDYDFPDKFIDDCGGEFLYPHILTDNCEKAVKVAFVLFWMYTKKVDKCDKIKDKQKRTKGCDRKYAHADFKGAVSVAV